MMFAPKNVKEVLFTTCRYVDYHMALSAILFQFRDSRNRKDQLLENPWKALGEAPWPQEDSAILGTTTADGFGDVKHKGIAPRSWTAPTSLLSWTNPIQEARMGVFMDLPKGI
ncbi:unnamed protein product [Caretta caretta]